MISQDMIHLFHDEAFATEIFKSFRYKEGIVCKKCSSDEHYWLKSKSQFQCKNCRFRTTLRSGTVLEGSKLPVSYFIIAIYLLSEKGNNVTPEELQTVTNHKYYDPVWVLLRKVKTFIKEEGSFDCLSNLKQVTNDLLVLKS